jgi:8-oxo-dGTP pyrophosphatase MutT (NUDIX family)
LAVLTIVFYGDKLALADIEGRGLCIPSGKIEPGESIDQAAEREAYEETGAVLAANRRRLIGCYRLVSRTVQEPTPSPSLKGRETEKHIFRGHQETLLNPPASGGSTESGGQTRRRYCPVFVAEALGFEPVPSGSESRGVLFVAIEEVADVYYTWDPLMAAVFEYADEQRQALFPTGTSLADIMRA